MPYRIKGYLFGVTDDDPMLFIPRSAISLRDDELEEAIEEDHQRVSWKIHPKYVTTTEILHDDISVYMAKHCPSSPTCILEDPEYQKKFDEIIAKGIEVELIPNFDSSWEVWNHEAEDDEFGWFPADSITVRFYINYKWDFVIETYDELVRWLIANEEDEAYSPDDIPVPRVMLEKEYTPFADADGGSDVIDLDTGEEVEIWDILEEHGY